MIAVLVSDLHPDASTGGLPRFDDVEKALGEAVDLAIKISADCFIFEGDLITNDPSIPLVIRSIGLLQRAGHKLVPNVSISRRALFAIPGNHDVFEDGHGTTALDVLDWDVVREPSLRVVNDEEGIVFLPFTPSSRSYDPKKACEALAEQARDDDVEVKLVCGHLNLEGINSGSEVNDFPRGREVFFPIEEALHYFPNAVLTCGHIHKRCTYRGVEVVGSLVNLTKGEIDNAPGFLVVRT